MTGRRSRSSWRAKDGCAPVYDAADVYADPYFRERGALIEYEDEVHGTVTGMGVIPRLTGTPGRVRQAARWTVGADTDDVLRELGYDEDERRQLHDDDVI